MVFSLAAMIGSLISCACGTANNDASPSLREVNTITEQKASDANEQFNYVNYDFKGMPEFAYDNRIGPKAPGEMSYVADYSDDPPSEDKNGLYGEDDRRFLNKNEYYVWPYRGVVQLTMKFVDSDGDEHNYVGTGALVGPNVVLTASHLIYSNDYGWSTLVKAYVGQYGSSYTDVSRVANSTIGVSFRTGDANDDWAICYLDDALGSTYGYFDVSDESLSYGDYGTNIAYNGSTRYKSEAQGGIYDVETYKFYHRIDAVAGASGSPIFYKITQRIVGIHSGGTHGDTYDYNIACRISSYLADWVEEARG